MVIIGVFAFLCQNGGGMFGICAVRTDMPVSASPRRYKIQAEKYLPAVVAADYNRYCHVTC